MISEDRDANLSRGLVSALVWIGSLAFAIAWFFSIQKLLRSVPPTEPFAIGRITLDGASKLRDYLGAAILYLFVPVATVAFHRIGSAFFAFLIRTLHPTRARLLAALLFTLPYAVSPMLFIATRSEGRSIIFPILFSMLGVYLVNLWEREASLRNLFRRELHAYHALVCAAGCAVLMFRYTTTGSRLANDRTLFLELPLIGLSLLMLLAAVLGIARLAARLRGESAEDVFPRIAWATSPLLLLAPLGLTEMPAGRTLLIVAAFSVALLLAGGFVRRRISVTSTRFIVAWVIVPMLLFCLNYASTASSTHWTDLFHRGEALGPASDYLRGKVPYRDVFVLHGLMENGFLDAGLMEVFGRDAQVSARRVIVFDALGLAAVGILAMAVFNSIPLTLATVAVSLVTSVGNQRSVFEILSVAFLVLALRRGRLLPLAVSGLFAALALFYSLETGIYSIGGALLTLVVLAILQRAGATESPLRLATAMGAFLGGFAVVAVPVLLYLQAHDAAAAFFRTSFVTIPSMIDAVWSLPFPRVESAFSSDRSLRAFADFVLGEKIRFVLNPAVLVLSLSSIVYRTLRKSINRSDQLLLALTFTAVLTQRSALGRSDFPHQYFAAFLLGPIIVLLLVALWNTLRNAVSAHGFAGKAFAAAIIAFVAAVMFIGLWVPDLVDARIGDTVAFRLRMEGAGNPTAPAVRERVEAIRDEVGRLVPPGEPIFDFSNQPALYFFADRPNPTRFYQIPIISSPQFQQEVIRNLESAEPEVVLRGSPAGFDTFDGVSNDLRAPSVAAYIDDHYQYSSSVQGVELWRRIDSPPPFRIEDYLAKHRMPTPVDVGDTQRRLLVFPSVASGAGASGSQWRSNLLLHNATDREVSVHIRYMSASNAARSIPLAARGTIEFPDVVGTLLDKPGTFGSLIVRSPTSAAVIARVTTYDSSRTSTGVPESPLTIEQSASSDGSMRHLVIPGQPVSEARRINIDAVNIGQTPAEIELAAFGRDGSAVGRSVIARVPEQASFRLSDAETQLGVLLDESVVVRITMIRGTVVASASLVHAGSGASRVVPGIPVP